MRRLQRRVPAGSGRGRRQPPRSTCPIRRSVRSLLASGRCQRAPLAQLAEQRTLNPRVRGSSPWRRTRSDLGLYRFQVIFLCPICPVAGSVLARVFFRGPRAAAKTGSDSLAHCDPHLLGGLRTVIGAGRASPDGLLPCRRAGHAPRGLPGVFAADLNQRVPCARRHLAQVRDVLDVSPGLCAPP
jgi:hypothetical protein